MHGPGRIRSRCPRHPFPHTDEALSRRQPWGGLCKKRPRRMPGPCRFGGCLRKLYIGLGRRMAKAAPCGSCITENRPVPGISVGGT